MKNGTARQWAIIMILLSMIPVSTSCSKKAPVEDSSRKNIQDILQSQSDESEEVGVKSPDSDIVHEDVWIELSPKSPTVEGTVRVVMHGLRKKGHSKPSVTWYVNDGIFQEGSEGRLSLSTLRKGDRVMAEVDFKGDKEKSFESDRIVVANSPPTISRVTYETSITGGRTVYRVKADGRDADGDDVSFRYRYFVNEQVYKEDAAGELDISSFNRGDTVYCIVIPSDDTEPGKEMATPVMKITNRPPRIVSSPPKRVEGNLFIYKIIAIDPDSDVLSYTLEQQPKGMVLNRDTINWALDAYEGPSPVKVVLRIEDGKGGIARQEFSLSLAGKSR